MIKKFELNNGIAKLKLNGLTTENLEINKIEILGDNIKLGNFEISNSSSKLFSFPCKYIKEDINLLKDFGFKIFVYLGNYLNLEFALFKAIIYFIFGIILINGLVRINKKSANLVLSLYIFYPLILDLVQIRHFMAMSTFIYAISFFIDSIKKNDVRIYNYLYFLPSIIFHNSFLFLFVLVYIFLIINIFTHFKILFILLHFYILKILNF